MARGHRITPSIGLVVPTLGAREQYLRQCLESIKNAGSSYVCLVAPEGFEFEELINTGLIDAYVRDPKSGLAAAINKGIQSMPESVRFVNWLGDDDLLEVGALTSLESLLDSDPIAVLAYGGCHYIDENGKEIWTNKSGSWAAKILTFGPDLIPQPSSLFLREAFNRVGGLNEKLKLAFDFDLFLRLSKLGRTIYTPQILASFRWHESSLSVGTRKDSVLEASMVRQSNRSAATKFLAQLWEPIIRLATYQAGVALSRRLETRKKLL